MRQKTLVCASVFNTIHFRHRCKVSRGRNVRLSMAQVGRLQTGLNPQGLLPLTVPRRHTTASLTSKLSIVFVMSWLNLVNLHVRQGWFLILCFLFILVISFIDHFWSIEGSLTTHACLLVCWFPDASLTFYLLIFPHTGSDVRIGEIRLLLQ